MTLILGAVVGIAVWEALAPTPWRFWVADKVDALWTRLFG